MLSPTTKPVRKTAPGVGIAATKNRAWGFFGDNVRRTWEIDPQVVEGHLEKTTPASETASGVPYWPSRDPIGEEGGVNLYAFVGNDGVNWRDYLGLECPSIGFAFTGWKPENGQSPDNFFRDMAGGLDNPNVGTGSSGADLFAFLEEKTQRCCCVKDLKIATHQSEAGFLGGPDHGFHGLYDSKERLRRRYIDQSWWDRQTEAVPSPYPNEAYLPVGSGARDLDELQGMVDAGKIKFCPGCQIKLHVCSPNRAFVANIAMITGCTVTAANGKCASVEEDGSIEQDPRRPWRSDPGPRVFDRNGRFTQEPAGFTEFSPGGSTRFLPNPFDPNN